MPVSKLFAWAAVFIVVWATASSVLAASGGLGLSRHIGHCSEPGAVFAGANCVSPPHAPPSGVAPPKMAPPKTRIYVPQKCSPPLIGNKPDCRCPDRGDVLAAGKCAAPPQKCDPPLIGYKPDCRCPDRGDVLAAGKCAAPPQKCEPPLIGYKPNCRCLNRRDVLAGGRCALQQGVGDGVAGSRPSGENLPVTPPHFAVATPPVVGQYRPNEVLAVLQPGATITAAQALARDHALQLDVFTQSRTLRTSIVSLHIPDARAIEAVLAVLSGDPRVLASQANYLYHPAAGASVPSSRVPQYSLDIIHAREAMANVKAGHTPIVAVIDTGIDESHPDLAGAVRDRFDAVGDGHWDVSSHGTGIAGIIAARGQLQGVDPLAALLSVRAFPATQGSGPAEATSLALVRGIDWSLETHADVINMSLAGPPDPVVDASVEEAMKAGVIVVAAAGNGGPDAPPAYPAAIKGVVAVTATDEHDVLFQGANRGAYISLAAPGVDVLSDTPGGGVALATGTSQAAAQVSGVLAMLRALRPELTPTQALELLSRTAKGLAPGDPNDSYGAGRVDAAAAVKGLGEY